MKKPAKNTTFIEPRTWLAFGLCGALGCASAGGQNAGPALKPPADTRTGVSDPRLADLVTRTWTEALEFSPLWATSLGIHDLDDRLDDKRPEALLAHRQNLAAFAAEVDALPPATLSEEDQLTRAILSEALHTEYDRATACRFEDWNLSASANPVTDFGYLPELHRVVSPADAENLLARYRQIAGSIDQERAGLARGAAQKLYANRRTAELVLENTEKLLAAPLPEWPLARPSREDHTDWDPAFQTRFRETLHAVLKDQVQPAFVRYRNFLRDEIVPQARTEAPGLSSLPLGAACYQASIRNFTTLDLKPEVLHALGLAELTRIHEEMRSIGQAALGTADRAEIFHRLRSDPALYFSSAEEIEAKAGAALALAKSKLPQYFETLPKADCVVRRIPDYEAPYSTIAYYRQPVPDGSKPGEYFVNVLNPSTRPRHEAEVLAFHESIPGHHLQIAIAQERPAVPAFRKHLVLNAYVEGWALYSERLADEMGLYSGPLDRLGMLSFDAWRAARLVVDTGLHAMGWSRAQAEVFMRENTAAAENNIKNEVDRYISWPGQALAYKVGQLEILKLREEAKATLGPRFDLRAFHERVLESGAVTLPILAERIQRWTKRSNEVAGTR